MRTPGICSPICRRNCPLLYGPAAGAFSGPGLCLNVWGLTVKMTAPGTLQASGISTRAYGSFSIFRCGLGSGSDFAVSGALVYFFFRNLAAGVGLSILRLFRLGFSIFPVPGCVFSVFGVAVFASVLFLLRQSRRGARRLPDRKLLRQRLLQEAVRCCRLLCRLCLQVHSGPGLRERGG